MRIEVGVEDDDSICAPKVDADAARTSCQEVYENIRILLIEFIHPLLTERLLCIAVLFRFVRAKYCEVSSSTSYKSEILGTLTNQEVFNDVECNRKLNSVSQQTLCKEGIVATWLKSSTR